MKIFREIYNGIQMDGMVRGLFVMGPVVMFFKFAAVAMAMIMTFFCPVMRGLMVVQSMNRPMGQPRRKCRQREQ